MELSGRISDAVGTTLASTVLELAFEMTARPLTASGQSFIIPEGRPESSSPTVGRLEVALRDLFGAFFAQQSCA
jgi:hypothetical protein